MAKIEIRKAYESIIDGAKKSWKTFVDANASLNAKLPDVVRTSQLKPEAIWDAYEAELKQLEEMQAEDGRRRNDRIRKASDELQKTYIDPLIASRDQNPGYAVKINNALQFIQAEGRNITDEAAFNILFDIRDDYTNMRRFEKIIETQTGRQLIHPGTGESLFPKTFSRMYQITKLLDMKKEIDDIGAALYVRPVRYQPDPNNEAGGITPRIANPVRLTEQTQEIRLLDLVTAMEPIIGSLQEGDGENGGYTRFLAEGRANPNEA